MVSSSVSVTSAQWVTQLVNYSLASERAPLDNLQAKRDTVNVRNAIYTDITSKIKAVQTSIDGLVGSTYGINNAFQAKSISVVNANADVNVASVKTSGTKAVAGTYDLNVSKLAQAHQITTARQAQSTVALGYSGTFVIGGAADRSVVSAPGSSNPVSSFTTSAAIREGEKELGTGNYSVEFRKDGETWQFRVVDGNGDAVSIDNASDTGDEMTASWQNFAGVKGGAFDTGRGMTINFSADADPSQAQLFGNTNIAHAAYTAKGASISVAATDTLEDIRTKIAAGAYADGNEVSATVVDRRLVLTASSTGADHAIKMSDHTGNVLQSLGVLSDATGTLKAGAELRAAQNAEFTINNISISRGSNSGLTDVVQGLSIDLLKEGQTKITVNQDSSGLKDTIKTLLKNVNDVMSYIKSKSEAVKGTDDEDGNPTYTAAALGSDWTVRSLRTDMASDLLGKYTGAVGNAPAYLYQIGITMNSSGEFVLSNETALTDALSSDFQGTQDLFSGIFNKLNDRLDRYVDGTGSILSYAKKGAQSEMDALKTQIDAYEKRLNARREALTTQYTAIQSQLIEMSYSYQSFQAWSSSLNLTT